MRAKVFFERTGLAFLFVAFAFSLSFAQKPLNIHDEFQDIPLDVEVLVSRMINGDYILLAFHPGESNLEFFASNPKKYGVKWYNEKGRLVSERAVLVSECGKKYRVVVTRYRTREWAATNCKTPACHNPGTTAEGIEAEVPKFY